MRTILASSSPRRRELLAQLGLRFEIVKPAIDESRRAQEDLVKYAERLSREKAEAVAQLLDGEPALIIAADTIVLDGGELLGKPADTEDARRMLRQLRGARTRGRHRLHTASRRRQAAGHHPPCADGGSYARFQRCRDRGLCRHGRSAG